ncbi:MAG: hypothetical protein ACXVC2_12270, partial [Bacteroidia bacterium]
PTAFDKANYGNAFPYLGTGQAYYVQAGYKFKDNLLGDQGTLQIYSNAQICNYNRLDDMMYVFDSGINWLIRGHNSKFTLDYQNRPYFTENASGKLKESSRKSQIVLQYQVAF